MSDIESEEMDPWAKETITTVPTLKYEDIITQ